MTECWNRRIMELSLSLAICQTVTRTDIMRTSHLTFCYIKIFLGACCPSLDMKTIDRGDFIFGLTISWGGIRGLFLRLGVDLEVCGLPWSVIDSSGIHRQCPHNPFYNSRYFPYFSYSFSSGEYKMHDGRSGRSVTAGIIFFTQTVIQKCEAIRKVFFNKAI